MGASISKYVFRPREPTYADDDGMMLYISRRYGERGGTAEKARIHWMRTKRECDIPGVFLRCEKRPARFTILLSHGNMEDLGIAASEASIYCDMLDSDIFLYEYTGFGIAQGKPSELNCYADILAAYEFLVHDAAVPPETIVLMGRSMGSGPTVWLASQKPVSGVILVAPFLSCARVVQNFKVTPPFDLFPNVDRIGAIECQVMYIHGQKDRIVPAQHTLDMLRRTRNPVEPLLIEEAGHNNVEKDFQNLVIPSLTKFLNELNTNLMSPSRESVEEEFTLTRSGWRLSISSEARKSSRWSRGNRASFNRQESFGSDSSDTYFRKGQSRNTPRSLHSLPGEEAIAARNNFEPRSLRHHVSARAETSHKTAVANVESRYNRRNSRSAVSSMAESLGAIDKNSETNYSLQSGLMEESSTASTDIAPATAKKIKMMRQGLSAAGNESFDDQYLLRFLRARRFNVAAATDLLYNYQKLGSTLGYDLRGKIPSGNVRRVLLRGIFHVTGAMDAKGAPIVFIRVSNYRPEETTLNEVAMVMLYYLDLFNDCGLGRKGICIVVDMKHFSKYNYSVESTRRFFQFLQKCYPTEIRKFIAVDSPKMLLKQWFVIRPLVKGDMAKVMSTRVTRSQLAKDVRRTLMPDFLGGEIDTIDPLMLLDHAAKIFRAYGH